MASLENLKRFNIINSEYYINQALDEGKKILAEGAQGSMLDIDFGSYPFVTSSNTITAGVCSGLGIAPSRIGNVFGICKAYCTRVGSGPFPTELFDADGEELRQKGREFGSTTGRPRRCGWFDVPALKYACMLNGVTHLMLMKIDVMNEFETIKLCEEYIIDGEHTMELPFDMEQEMEPVYSSYKGWQQSVEGIDQYENLPENMKQYISKLEEKTGLPIVLVSTSPNRKDTIIRTEI
jgi:adenylosuccinate synthase